MASQRPDTEWISLLNTLLGRPALPEDLELDPELAEDADFQKLLRFIQDLRDLSHALSRGNLQMFTYSKGFVLSNLKALQSHLRHLTWQTKQVAEGDFSQRVEFLGDFSEAFNEMVLKLESNTQELENLANVDFLTQLPNRRSAMQYLDQVFILFKRNRRPFSILGFDIDHFKNVNDTYGHDAGDIVLRAFSHTLKQVFRESDMFCRLGGEEFTAILPETEMNGAAIIAERARKAFEDLETDLGNGILLKKTVSIGVTEAGVGDRSAQDVINRGDVALYEAKETGRNKVVLLPPEPGEADDEPDESSEQEAEAARPDGSEQDIPTFGLPPEEAAADSVTHRR